MGPSFRRLWLGQSVSLLGSQLALLALPLIAVVQLHASVESIGGLTLVGYLPFLLLSVPIGSWVDRWPRRPVLVGTNLARAAVVGVVALLASEGRLRMADLYVMSVVTGVLGLMFVVAFRAVIPDLIDRDSMVAAQSRLTGSQTAASIVGPGLGGVLIAAFSAPVALVLDAASFVVAAVVARGVTPVGSEAMGAGTSVDGGGDPAGSRSAGGGNGHGRGRWLEGLRTINREPALRMVAAEGAIANLCGTMVGTLFIVFAVRVLSLGAPALGVVMAAGGVGALAGATGAGRLGKRFGTGHSCLVALALADISLLALPAIRGHGTVAVVGLLAAVSIVGGGATTVFEVHTSALTYDATPPDLHGRIQAGLRFVGSFGLVGGAVLGGVLGQVLGVRVALLVAAAIGLCHWPVVLRSPLNTSKPNDVEESVVAVVEGVSA